MKTIPSKVFVDTNVFFALRDKDDPTHKKAERILKLLNRNKSTLYTSSDIIGETLTLLSRRLGKIYAKEFQDEVAPTIIEIFIDETMHAHARKLFLNIISKNISFIDCSSVIAMKENRIEYAFTFDKHFERLGVKPLKAR